jgi:soluble lytic murein transglycosylase-like protein
MTRLVLVFVLVAAAAEAQIPRAALTYRRQLIANARAVWGLDAPISLFASQVAQESGFNPKAQSPYAKGIAQFTSATALWIGEAYPDELGDVDVFNPAWGLRALARLDKHWHERATFAANECSRFGFVLSAYNGGGGWWPRDRALAAKRGADTRRWFNHVEKHSPRAAWAFKENRDYVKRIIFTWQPRFVEAGWGQGIKC